MKYVATPTSATSVRIDQCNQLESTTYEIKSFDGVKVWGELSQREVGSDRIVIAEIIVMYHKRIVAGILYRVELVFIPDQPIDSQSDFTGTYKVDIIMDHDKKTLELTNVDHNNIVKQIQDITLSEPMLNVIDTLMKMRDQERIDVIGRFGDFTVPEPIMKI